MKRMLVAVGLVVLMMAGQAYAAGGGGMGGGMEGGGCSGMADMFPAPEVDQNRAALSMFPRPQVNNIVAFLKTLSDGYFLK